MSNTLWPPELQHAWLPYPSLFPSVLVTESCPTLCNHMDCSPPGSSVYGTSLAIILEWVVISFSRDLPKPGIKPMSLESPAFQADSLPPEPLEKFAQTHVHWVSDGILLSPNECEQTPGDSKGQGGLVCCGPWGLKNLDMT